MAYEAPMTVREAIEGIADHQYLIPAIQRELVWEPNQITKLFDSLMQGYPIGAFLFWKVSKKRTREYRFYDFLRDYHEKKSVHNPKASVSGKQDVTAVLDGQQRLTAFYVGLKGTYAYRRRYARRDAIDAYPERRLHLNLLSPADDPERRVKYDFRFLTEEETEERNEHTHWFRVGAILDFDPENPAEIHEYMIEHDLGACRRTPVDAKRWGYTIQEATF